MITLCMIVKNEAATIGRCLASVKPLLSAWCIVDTGSTDGTQEIIREALRDIPGRLHRRDWVNFGKNLTDALGLAAEYGHPMLRLDADMTVQGQPGWLPRGMPHDCALVTLEDRGLSYRLPLLVSPGKRWIYRGATHEYLDCATAFTRANLDGFTVIHHADGGSRADKFSRDLALLLPDAARGDARSTYYLAQTYRDMGETLSAIEAYQQRSKMGGFEEEAWHAEFQAARLLESPEALMQAYQRRPSRAEPLYYLARLYRLRGQDSLALMAAREANRIPFPAEDLLFVEREVYTWGTSLELAIAHQRLGQLEPAAVINQWLLKSDLPPHVRACVARNESLRKAG